MICAGLIRNPKSRRHREGQAPPAPPAHAGLHEAAPQTPAELDAALARFAAERIELLVIDAGDGTVREVLTRAPPFFPAGLPPLAVLPSGKTNALALDLGAPAGWPLEAALASAKAGRRTWRSPLEIVHRGQPANARRGFIFGAGAFVRGVELAQKTHSLGAFDNMAVGLTLGAAALRTLLGGPRSGWRKGEPMGLAMPDEPAGTRRFFLVLASTLERLPLGVKPFGASGQGLRTLAVEAPPRRLVQALGPVLAGHNPKWLEAAGYRRRTVETFGLRVESSYILDGETFPGGDLEVRRGTPLEFVVP